MRIFSVALAFLTMTFSTAAFADDQCHSFFEGIRSQVLAVIRDHQHNFDYRYGKLQTLFNQSVDAEWIARFSAGPYWRTASDQERKDFVAAYAAYLSDHYIGGLSEENLDTMQDIKLVAFSPEADQAYRARTKIDLTNSEPLSIEYLLQAEPSGSCRLRDFTIEGVSMLMTQRDQVRSLAAANGLNAVTQKLRSLLQHHS